MILTWDEIRQSAAILAMNGLLSNSYHSGDPAEDLAKKSVKLANILVEQMHQDELRRKKEAE